MKKNFDIPVLYRDRFLIAVRKPAGLAVYGDSQHAGCKEVLEKRLGQKLFPVHRLDKDTCGVILYALSPESAADLIRSFKKRGNEKTYYALVFGVFESPRSIRKPLKKHKSKELEPAWTDIDPVATFSHGGLDFTWVRAFPRSGRFHQIRRHLAAEGFAIVGDPIYSPKQNGISGAPLMLFAQSIKFAHPRTRKALRVDANLNEEMKACLKHLGFSARL